MACLFTIIFLPKDVDLSWVVDVMMSCTKSLSFAEGGCDRACALERKLGVSESCAFHLILRISCHFERSQKMRMFFKHRPCFCYQVLLWANHLLLKFWVIQGARKKEKAIIPAESANHISCKSCFQWDKIENAAALKFSGSFYTKISTLFNFINICNDIPGSFVETKRYMTSSPESLLHLFWLLSDFYRGNLMVW